jgi:signal transduction histidine kinase
MKVHETNLINQRYSVYRRKITLPNPDPPPKKSQKSAKAQAARHARSGSNLDRMTLLAHQLRAPLSIISALAQSLARRGHRMTPGDVCDRGKKIWHASLRLDELIGTIMNYTRANAGGIVIGPTVFDIKAVLQRISKEQERLAGVRRCELHITALPDQISGDAVLIEQALSIVLANAMRYSAEDSRVVVTGSVCEKAISIAIKDEGIGISASDLPFVSQPFFRGANAKHIPGTGLGLSLARHIVSLHAGELSIESEEGIGTTVRIKLPREAE